MTMFLGALSLFKFDLLVITLLVLFSELSIFGFSLLSPVISIRSTTFSTSFWDSFLILFKLLIIDCCDSTDDTVQFVNIQPTCSHTISEFLCIFKIFKMESTIFSSENLFFIFIWSTDKFLIAFSIWIITAIFVLWLFRAVTNSEGMSDIFSAVTLLPLLNLLSL